MITEPFHTLDHLRKSFNGATSRADRSKIGHFLTPVAIAWFMSSMFETGPQEVRALDPGTGAGALFVDTLISRGREMGTDPFRRNKDLQITVENPLQKIYETVLTLS
ncbi:hypothetical protein PITCH_A180012 [uncultured Desulfobacterium sp.]|uniref:DNA methylase adenine-specific domain-containing protein n=1 Tax=uncultured Desulfobacterium sp. TaxID=201089 RepID=A0A445MUZ7_9BACT|nr:hypothetical protein PITCH_A180012 [uncultured Desulfobacterium sp.]